MELRYTVWYLVEAHLATMALALFMLALVLRVLGKEQRPSASFAWILAILLVPYIGIPAYVIFGGRKIRAMVERKQRIYVRPTAGRLRLQEFDNPAEDVLSSHGVKLPSRANCLRLITTGEEAFADLCALIDEARSSIYIETYILKRDSVGRAIIERLAKRAAEGIDVRLLLDSYGCLTITRGFVAPLTRAGGRVAWFLPMLPRKREWSLNLRNHRKLVVVDSKHAVLGGMNIGHEYMGPDPCENRWTDTTVDIRGPAVKDILEIFCSDWNFASSQKLDPSQFAAFPAPDGPDIAQVAASGPDVASDPLYDAVLKSIYAAHERVWVVTPYFAPGEEMLRALLIQARIGRDVRLIMPQKSNHPITDLVRAPYLRELAEAGAQVLVRPGRMLHAKSMVFDDHTAVIGSVNFDQRSLYLNFEVSMFVYTAPRIQEIAEWTEDLCTQSRALSLDLPSGGRRLLERLAFLVSPLL
jgi:cardiolipin synthase